MSSSLEINKIVGAILVAALVAQLSGILAEFLVKPKRAGESAVTATGGEGGGQGGEAAKPAPEAIEPVSGLLANADVSKGEEIAKKCAACHSFGKGEAAKVGPNLWGIVGNKHGHMEGFAYSQAIASIDRPWSYEELDQFIANPKAHAPGTKMGFAGLKKVEERADVIAWLRTLSDNPQPLPTQAEIDAAQKAFEAAQQGAAAPAESGGAAPAAPAQPSQGETQTAAAPADDSAAVVAMIGKADPAQGEAAAKKCAACHSFVKGGSAKVGPNLWNVVGGPKAQMEGFSYSDAMKNAGGDWDYASLAKFLASPKAFVPGTKMSFPGLKKPEDRANVIAWLRTLSDNPQPLP